MGMSMMANGLTTKRMEKLTKDMLMLVMLMTNRMIRLLLNMIMEIFMKKIWKMITKVKKY